MARRLNKTLIDYIVIAINPVLIMFLIGSLLYFLLEVLYQGGYGGRLRFIFAMFVMATVLIGRISIEEGKERAGMFAAPLAVVTFIALGRFVHFSGPLAGISWLVNMGLIGLVWWCAHKLTWDCTLIDETQDASGEGLLQTAGLDERTEARKKVDAQQEPDPEGVTSRHVSEPSWWQRLVERDRTKHAPGVWVIYFSLVALPMFGFLQRWGPDDPARRRYMFFLFLVYLASGLGLLLNTSFLGLRRYLRQRRVEMPAAMAGMWLAMGCGLVLALLVVAALVPRPNAEYAWADLSFHIDSGKHKSSPFSFGSDGADENEDGPRTGRRKTEERPESGGGGEGGESGPGSQKNGGDSGSQSKSKGGNSSSGKQSKGGSSSSDSQQKQGSSGSDSSSKQQPSRSGSESDQSSNNQSQSGGEDPGEQAKEALDSESGNNQSSQRGDSQNQGGRSGSRSEQQPDRSPPDGKSDRRDSQAREDSRSGNRERSRDESSSEQKSESDRSGNRTDQPQETKSQAADDDSPSGGKQSQRSFNPLSMIRNVGGFLFGLLKWILFLAVIAIGLYWLWRSREEVIRFLRDLARAWRDFWARLFSGKSAVREETPAEETPKGPAPRPFADFADPFLSGAVDAWSPDQVVKYTFEALEAWARERDCPRTLEQTPCEFSRQLGRDFKPLSKDVRRFADLYSLVAYAPGTIPARKIEPLRDLWQHLQESHAVPASTSGFPA